MATEEIEKNVRDLGIGDILTIGSNPYKVESVEYDGDEEYTITLKYANKHYLTPEDFIYLTVNFRHLLRVKPKTA